MADGKGCKCAAYDASECACDVDWTPQELIDARAEIARLRGDAEVMRLRLEAAHAEIARLRLTDDEREAVKLATDFLEDEFYGCSDKCKAEHEAVATLRTLLERLRT